jgi:hypothetical protein
MTLETPIREIDRTTAGRISTKSDTTPCRQDRRLAAGRARLLLIGSSTGSNVCACSGKQ